MTAAVASQQRPCRALPKTVKIRLARLMRDRNLTLTQLAELTSISRQTLGLWRRSAAARYDPITIGKLCEALDCRIEDLLELVEVDADDI
jgi:putative transcriptional regulator